MWEGDGGEARAERLRTDADSGGVQQAGGGIKRDGLDFEGGVGGVGLEDLEVGGEEGAGDEDGVGGGVVGEADGAAGGFIEGAGTVIERGVDGLEPGELGEEALVNPVREERALAALGLVRGVGGGEVADAGDLGDDGWDAIDGQAVAEEGGSGCVAGGEGSQAVNEGVVGKLVGDRRRGRHADVDGEVREKVIKPLGPDGAQHGGEVGIARGDVMAGELARERGGVVTQRRARGRGGGAGRGRGGRGGGGHGEGG